MQAANGALPPSICAAKKSSLLFKYGHNVSRTARQVILSHSVVLFEQACMAHYWMAVMSHRAVNRSTTAAAWRLGSGCASLLPLDWR